MGLFSKNTHRSKVAKVQQAIREEAQVRTSAICKEIIECTQQAIEANNIYNIMSDGQIDESIGKMKIIYLPVNGNSSTIIVSLPSNRAETTILGVRGFNAFQFDVNLSNVDKELHIYGCFCGTDLYVPIENLVSFKDMIMDKIALHRQYPLTNT